MSKSAVIWKLTYEGGIRPKTRRKNEDVCVVTLLTVCMVTLLPVHFNCVGKGDCSGGGGSSPKNQHGAQVASWPCHATDPGGMEEG